MSCEECGGPLLKSKRSGYIPTRFCCMDCRRAFAEKKRTHICFTCEKTFVVPKTRKKIFGNTQRIFCDRVCADQLRRKKKVC